MPPSRLPALKLRRDAGGAIRIATTPDRSTVIARAAGALGQLTHAAKAPGARPVDVQPVVEVADVAGYARWRTDREAIWRTQGGVYTTAGWPAGLAADGLAAVLLPLPHGAASGRGKDAPRVVADPLFSTRSRADGSEPEDVALHLIAEWLVQATTGPPLRVAPPVLVFGSERRVLDLGLRWPLAAAAR